MEQALHIATILGYLYVFYLVAVLFTNGIEWLGLKFKLPAGALGSVFAAVGTAMPETLIALIAIFSGAVAKSGENIGHEIGTGAILGAPFLLSSAAFFVIGATYVISKSKGIRTGIFDVDGAVIRTDIGYFLVAYSVAALAGLYPRYVEGIFIFGIELARVLHIALGIVLLSVYVLYVAKVVGKGGAYTERPDMLLALKWLWHALPVLNVQRDEGAPHPAEDPKRRWILFQLAASLALLVFLARGFVYQIEWLSAAWGIPAVILSLLIIPIATELPEKLNSIIWVRAGQDTLAMGNVSGAMVFQSSIPVTIGLWFTDWSFSAASYAFCTCVLAVASGVLVWLDLKRTNEISHKTLLLGGIFYVVFILLVVFKAFPG